MIKVISGTSLNKTELVIDPSTTLMEAAEQAGLNVPAGGITLNGSMVSGGDFNKTFNDYGVTDKCYLLQVVKADNA
jgi:hypothetical protein